MLTFIGLEWDPRCLEFHTNKRQVTTASAWAGAAEGVQEFSGSLAATMRNSSVP